MEVTKLSKDEEEKIKKSLFDFVIRVSSGDSTRQGELSILPEMTNVLLYYFSEGY